MRLRPLEQRGGKPVLVKLPTIEWAYDRQSPIGRLDKGLDEAKRNGWIVASMSADWLRIFPFQQ
jgi:hypothetical protein